MICKNCIHSEVCKHKTEAVYECEHFADGTIKNQYDRIRNMSVEEMAEFLNKISNCLGMECKDCPFNSTNCMSKMGIKQYLESEVEGE
jgi:hypothetical protein